MRLIKFESDDCHPCHLMKPIYSQACEKTSIRPITISANSVWAEIFNITAVPSFVLMSNEGKELRRTQGVMSKDQMVKWIKEG